MTFTTLPGRGYFEAAQLVCKRTTRATGQTPGTHAPPSTARLPPTPLLCPVSAPCLVGRGDSNSVSCSCYHPSSAHLRCSCVPHTGAPSLRRGLVSSWEDFTAVFLWTPKLPKSVAGRPQNGPQMRQNRERREKPAGGGRRQGEAGRDTQRSAVRPCMPVTGSLRGRGNVGPSSLHLLEISHRL